MRLAITGGSGSLGRALLTRFTQTSAERLVTFSRDESKRAALQKDFGWHPGVRIFAGDIRDGEWLHDLFHECDVVVHAAARKVVSAQPDEAREMHFTNVIGTQNVINAARRAGVRQLLFISSDKAVRPENCYGITKALAEYLVINANARAKPQGLRLSVLRYGNVLGSTGSVLKAWWDLAQQRKPFHLSDPAMTRFWLTLDRAVDLVQQALTEMRGGEIFVPDLPAAPLTVLAQALGADELRYDVLGIRPGGEKLHEELLSAAEVRRTVRRNGWFIVPPYQSDAMWDNRPWLGERLPEDFTYRSDTWVRQLDVVQMTELVKAAMVDQHEGAKV